MCTVIILRRPGAPWPVFIGANRDERLDRAWDPPAAWWPDRPGVVGGRDRDAGGTWMAANDAGVVATVLNRPGSLGPAPGKRSRGELPLLALEHATAEAAAAAIAALPAAEWRPFNMVLADSGSRAFFLRGVGAGRPEALPLPEGVSMVTALDPNDRSSPRTARHLPRFRAAPPPDPDRDSWAGWEALLADDGFRAAAGPAEALCVPPTDGFGTVCSSVLGLRRDGPRIWRFANGAPCRVPFAPLPPLAPPVRMRAS
jgi:Transport and Golgi organisation 2